MDDQRARELLSQARQRIEQELRGLAGTVSDEESTDDLADNATDTYQNEYDEGRRETLQAQLDAVARAEQRLADGRYGVSVESGDPIPDGRLEAIPWAERTAPEEEQYQAGR
jgi:DnaK suppressor protein